MFGATPDLIALTEFISYRRVKKLLMHNGIPGYELRRVSPRPDRHPNGLPIIIAGEPICMLKEDAVDMLFFAGEQGIEPCESEGDPRIYRIGQYILVPENSGL